MVSEKVEAAAVASTLLANGASASEVARVYRTAIRANRKRLSR